MRLKFCILFSTLLSVQLAAQVVTGTLQGKVSYMTSQNTYVRFKSTSGISAGDSLYIFSGGKLIPALKVTGLSSTSCVCTSISDVNLTVSTDIFAREKAPVTKPVEKAAKDTRSELAWADTTRKPAYQNLQKQRINGSISAYSYSNFSNTVAKNSYSFRYNFTLDARNIGNSKFSAESYVSFRHKSGEWAEVKSNIFNALKIFDLAVRYDLNKTTQISLGRKINPKIASIGPMDGLQVEKSFGNFSLGGLVGYRPDYMNFGFDSKLFQYGAYVAFNTKTALSYSESSLAFMEQMNNWKTDRRFIYFQHSNSIIKNLYFFGSVEMDLFRIHNNVPQNTFDLTGLYLSLNYRIGRNLTVTGSYDERKNIMYYETYKSLIDSVLINEMRQSYRLRVNYRLTNNLTLGVEPGYRFLKSDPHPSKNVYGYLSYNQIPWLNVTITLSGTYLESNYMNGKILGANISRDLFKGKFQTSLGYHYVDYSLPESLLTVRQNIGELNLYWQLSRTISFSVNYEGTFQKNEIFHRVYLQVRKRF